MVKVSQRKERNMKSFNTKYLVMVWLCSYDIVCGNEFTFYGGQGSYVKYPILNTSVSKRLHISFEFKSTETSEQLVLYVDDILNGGKDGGDYMRITLKDGRLHILRKIESEGKAKDVMSIGHNLHDNIKHFVEINRSETSFDVTLDGEMETLKKLSRNVRLNSNVFLGGSPEQNTLSRDAYFNFFDRFVIIVEVNQYLFLNR